MLAIEQKHDSNATVTTVIQKFLAIAFMEQAGSSRYEPLSNKEFFSRLEIEGADKARMLQSRLGWPSDQQYKEGIQDNLIMNADVTVDDINRA